MMYISCKKAFNPEIKFNISSRFYIEIIGRILNPKNRIQCCINYLSHFFIYVLDVQLKVTKSNVLIQDLVAFACLSLKNKLSYPCLFFSDKQAKVAKSCMSTLALSYF
jgi:hypothetical protein